jgi:hypothetical protein
LYSYFSEKHLCEEICVCISSFHLKRSKKKKKISVLSAKSNPDFYFLISMKRNRNINKLGLFVISVFAIDCHCSTNIFVVIMTTGS